MWVRIVVAKWVVHLAEMKDEKKAGWKAAKLEQSVAVKKAVLWAA